MSRQSSENGCTTNIRVVLNLNWSWAISAPFLCWKSIWISKLENASWVCTYSSSYAKYKGTDNVPRQRFKKILYFFLPVTRASLRKGKGLSTPISISLKFLWRQKSSHLRILYSTAPCTVRHHCVPQGCWVQHSFSVGSNPLWECSRGAGWVVPWGQDAGRHLRVQGWHVASPGLAGGCQVGGATGNKCLVTWWLSEPCQLQGPSLVLLGAGGESLPESCKVRCQGSVMCMDSFHQTPHKAIPLLLEAWPMCWQGLVNAERNTRKVFT